MTTKKKAAGPTPDEARQYLAVVTPEWRAFWVYDGPVIASLKDLAAALPKFSVDSFLHHVNEAKNDFAEWIEHVIGDRDLAAAVRDTKTVKQLLGALERRLKELDKCLLNEGKKAAKKK